MDATNTGYGRCTAKRISQAGCHQCHASDLVLDHATVLNTGKEIFRGKGCMGCHRLEGFDAEAEALTGNRQTIRKLEGDRKELEKNIEQSWKRCRCRRRQ